MENGDLHTNHFFEAWVLNRGSWAPYGNTDVFARGTEKVARFSVSAIANFYKGVPLPLSMVPHGVPQAGDLPSSYTAPVMPVPPSGPPVIRSWTSGYRN
jgi:hypothetical protein